MNKEKHTATSCKLIKAVYASYVYVYSSFLYNSCVYKWNEILICNICGQAGNVLHENSHSRITVPLRYCVSTFHFTYVHNYSTKNCLQFTT